jgi:hypothetical protein
MPRVKMPTPCSGGAIEQSEFEGYGRSERKDGIGAARGQRPTELYSGREPWSKSLVYDRDAKR